MDIFIQLFFTHRKTNAETLLQHLNAHYISQLLNHLITTCNSIHVQTDTFHPNVEKASNSHKIYGKNNNNGPVCSYAKAQDGVKL